jgi:outer membrane receptor protein involved in Fe transport
VDENGVVVPSARLSLEAEDTQILIRGQTDYAGRWEAREVVPGAYRLRADKEGFYVVQHPAVRVGEVEAVELTLPHQQEYVESVSVVYSPPAIDPVQTASTEQLNSREIINLPHPVTRDIRYALPLLPGVLQDASGQIHVDGAATHQIHDQLDGFNITGPATGLLNLRVSVDALRSVKVESSRVPAEFGKGSGGVLSLATGIGDDHMRFTATDFIPALQSERGIHLNTWTPRGLISGPLRKGKAWFLLAPEGEYNLDIVKELPPGQDQSFAWRVGNLAKAQINWKENHVLTSSLVFNRSAARNFGLTRFDPEETTVDVSNQATLFTVRDQSLLANGLLLELGLGISRFHGELQPQGEATYVITPEGTSGNYYTTAESRSGRIQGIANVYVPPLRWQGRHEIKAGIDVERVTFEQFAARRPFLIRREDGTLSRQVTFAGSPNYGRNNSQLSAYAQDRWAPSDRAVVEAGLRFDWDQIVHRVIGSPRLAASFLASRRGDTKIVAGLGLYYDPSSLEFISRPRSGQRTDFFFDANGQSLVRPPLETRFHVGGNLRTPRFLNWSVGIERELPLVVILRAEYLQKRGRSGWAYFPQGAGASELTSLFEFQTTRRDKFDSLEIALRRAFRAGHSVFAAYTRSAARSNAVLDFDLDTPLFSPQVAGPLPWDAPHRFQSWGWLPFWKGFDLAYALDWRSGFPFALVNEEQQIVAAPGARRFPAYFTLNVHLERRLRLLGFEWALRAGVNNLTDRANPSAVNNNVDSPQFMTLGGLQGRAFIARLRLLGRK